MTELTLLSARLAAQAGLFDVTLAGGRVLAIAPSGAASRPGPSLDLAGRLLLPALADGHLHLDKTFLGAPWRPHVPGATIAERIAAERDERARVAMPLRARAARLVEKAVGFGTLAIRSHVDVDEAIGLTHVETLLELRSALGGRIDLQLVAFPQSGLSVRVAELMEEAIRLGVDVVGGLDPATIDGDIEASLAVVFGLAERHDRRIDIHLHDAGALGAFELRRIAARAKAGGLQGRVAVSHAFALGMIDARELATTADALAEGGVAIMTNGPGADAMPPLLSLIEAGVTVFGGSDNVRDAWSPFGDADLLRRAGQIAYRADFRTDKALRLAFGLVTDNSRAVMGLERAATEVGAPADLIAVDAGDTAEAVADPSSARLVIRSGQVVSGI